MFRKTNISYPLIRTHTCAYQGVKNIGFLANFAYELNEWSAISVTPLASKQSKNLKIHGISIVFSARVAMGTQSTLWELQNQLHYFNAPLFHYWLKMINSQALKMLIFHAANAADFNSWHFYIFLKKILQCLGSNLHIISYFLRMVCFERVEIRSTFNDINIRNMIFMVWTQAKEDNITIQDITNSLMILFVRSNDFPVSSLKFFISDSRWPKKRRLQNLKKKILESFNYSERTSNLQSLRENCQNTEFFLVRVFLYSDWMKGNKDQKKLRIWTLFKQWMILTWKVIQSRNLLETDANRRNNKHKYF